MLFYFSKNVAKLHLSFDHLARLKIRMLVLPFKQTYVSMMPRGDESLLDGP